MSYQNPTIVYIGSEEHADTLCQTVQPEGWHVLRPAEMMEALAMQVFYYPDVVIIEDAPEVDFAPEAYAHLRSVGMENILVLTNTPEGWGIVRGDLVRALPTYSSIEAIIFTVKAMTEVFAPVEELLVLN